MPRVRLPPILDRATRGPLARLRGDLDLDALRRGGLRCPGDVFVGSRVYLDPDFCFLIEIGPRAVITRGAIVLAHDSSTKRALGYTRLAPVSIGADAFIGAGSVILPGVTVGEHAVVGAGSIVNADVEPRTIVAGNPARPIGDYDAYMERHAAGAAQGPSWPRRGWARSSGITPARRAEMLARLEEAGQGYIE